MKAVCNHCHDITNIEYKKANHPNGIEETYFKCEHCFYRYTSFVTDSWVRKKQRALKGLPRGDAKVLDGKQIEINNRMATLKDNLINYGKADL